ncbi:unnamed protein product [Urochloa humidicola]
MPPNGHPPPPPHHHLHRQIRPSPTSGGQSPRPNRSTAPAQPRIQPLAASVRKTAWESFFSDSPPPPPTHGCPVTDEVEWVPATPDRPPSYADAVRGWRSKEDTHKASQDPAFTPPQRPAARHSSKPKVSAAAVTPPHRAAQRRGNYSGRNRGHPTSTPIAVSTPQRTRRDGRLPGGAESVRHARCKPAPVEVTGSSTVELPTIHGTQPLQALTPSTE